MTAREKVVEAEGRIRELLRHAQDGTAIGTLVCPFCDSVMMEGEPFCCREFAGVSQVVLEHLAFLEVKETADRVMDRVMSN